MELNTGFSATTTFTAEPSPSEERTIAKTVARINEIERFDARLRGWQPLLRDDGNHSAKRGRSVNTGRTDGTCTSPPHKKTRKLGKISSLPYPLDTLTARRQHVPARKRHPKEQPR